jgi:hypothetical protein
MLSGGNEIFDLGPPNIDHQHRLQEKGLNQVTIASLMLRDPTYTLVADVTQYDFPRRCFGAIARVSRGDDGPGSAYRAESIIGIRWIADSGELERLLS